MYRCRDCDSTKVKQQVFGMVYVNGLFGTRDITWDWDDYYFCDDCDDEAKVYFKEKEE